MTPPVERPSTPPGIRAKIAEGEVSQARLTGQVEVMGARLDALADGQKQTRADVAAVREDVAELRGEMREVAREDARRDAEVRAEVRLVSGEVAALRRDLDTRLDSIERTLTFCAGKEAGGSGGATLPTLPAALSPITSGGQARRAAAVGGGGLTLASLLGLLASLATLPLAVQWALGGVAVLAGVGAVAVAVRWGWRAAGR